MDDDDFSDDGFDGLNDSVLQELEAKAIQSTQARLASTQQPSQAAAPRQPSHRQQPQRPGPHQPQQQRQTPPQPPQPRRQAQQEHDSYDYGLDDDDLDDTEVFEQISQQPRGSVAVATATSRPIQAARLPANIAGHRSAFVRPQQQQSQFAPRSVPQQSQFVPRPPPQLSQFVRHPPPRPSQLAPQLLPIRATYGVNPPQGPPAPAAGNSKQDDNSAAIQAKLSETEAKLMSAQGEIAILRSKLDKAQRDRQEEVDRVKKQAAEHAAKQERLIEEERAAHRTADTELQFARQNLREGLGRARNKKHDAGATTPKKAKKWGQADGFDNLEVMSVSPGKGHAGLRRNNSGPGAQSTTERTPTKGKRKRPAVDSPSFALEIQETDSGIITGKAGDPMYLQIRPANDLPYDFLRLVLEHSAHLGQPPTFDLFSRYAFPSEPGQTFAAIAFQKLSRLGDAKEPLRLLVDFAQMILDMWQRCLTERYHAPIYYLASLVRYTLDLNAMAVAPRVISSLIPVCTSTCRLVAEPRFHSVGGNLSSHPNSGVRQLCLDVDVTQCLEILHLAALGCVVQSAPSLGGNSVVDWVQPQCSPQEQFWRTIEPDFVLMMLDKKHPERDWLAIIGLLWSSVLPGSIGPIPTKVSMAAVPMAPPNRGNANANVKRTEAEDSADAAMGVIRRVAYFLTDMPSWAPRGTIKELKVRSNALRTLMIFASSPFGAMQIAKNDAAIPRLVTAWSWAIDRLYDVDGGLPRMKTTPRPKGSKAAARKKAAVADAGDAMDVDRAPQDEPPQDENLESDWSEEDEQVDEIDDGAQLFAQLPKFISEATRLLHMLITHPRTANVVDIADKLATYPGATQRYFLTLARLSLQEDDLIIDASIPFETADLAGEMLRMVVNMEDAEAFHEAFPDSVQH